MHHMTLPVPTQPLRRARISAAQPHFPSASLFWMLGTASCSSSFALLARPTRSRSCIPRSARSWPPKTSHSPPRWSWRTTSGRLPGPASTSWLRTRTHPLRTHRKAACQWWRRLRAARHSLRGRCQRSLCLLRRLVCRVLPRQTRPCSSRLTHRLTGARIRRRRRLDRWPRGRLRCPIRRGRHASGRRRRGDLLD